MANNSQSSLSAHTLTEEQMCEAQATSLTHGLTSSQVEIRYQKYGRNIIEGEHSVSWVKIFVSQFTNAIVAILLLATLISGLYGHYLDVSIILGIILVNALVGFIQEYQAQKSINALKKLTATHVHVRRNSVETIISSHELVPGDIIILFTGDTIAADARLVKSNNLQTQESTLTGESFPVSKYPNVTLPENTPLAERVNMLWMGTAVVSGHGEAVVTDIGSLTQLGSIASRLSHLPDHIDHFKIKTNELARQMGFVAIVTVFIMFIVGYFFRHFHFEEILTFSMASLVSAIPEGLPVILTLVLALSAKRMVKRNVLIRRLSATETLAVVDTIITDKTGTLTKNQMTVSHVWLPFFEPITVTNDNAASLFEDPQHQTIAATSQLFRMFEIANFCHAVHTTASEKGSSLHGEATEIALVTFAQMGSSAFQFSFPNFTKMYDLPFQQDVRLRATLVKKNGEEQIFVIGSPESILKQSTAFLSKDDTVIAFSQKEHHERIQEKLNELTENGIRVVALAYKKPQDALEKIAIADIHSLTFVGLIGITDPPKRETKQAISEAVRAGIHVIMATGDHPKTAYKIAKDIGLLSGEAKHDALLTESEFETLSDEELIARLPKLHVCARMSPESKLRLAILMQQAGHVVAMTGDGVNDAPALKQADIGIAMGKNGTDVARQASDIILTDDNFASIIAAIEEGRTQLRNVRRTSFFYITTNFAETLTLIIFLFLGLPIPLLPKQILWLNLVTAGITDIALAMEPTHEDVMKTLPKSSKDPVLNKQVIPYLAIITLVVMILSVIAFSVFEPQGIQKARTAVFVILAVTQLFTVFNLRSIRKTIFSIGLFSSPSVNIAILLSFVLLISVLYIPLLRFMFEFHALSIAELGLCIVGSSLVFWASEFYKKFILPIEHNKT